MPWQFWVLNFGSLNIIVNVFNHHTDLLASVLDTVRVYEINKMERVSSEFMT